MKMQVYIYVLLCLGLTITAQAKFEFTQTAKECVASINTDEDTIRSLVKEEEDVPENNELVENFFACIFRNFLNDKNELIVDEKLTNYVVKIISVRMDGKQKMAILVAKDCLEQCKGVKGNSKGKTAVNVMNCLKKKFNEYREE